jgi:hypothetical protein
MHGNVGPTTSAVAVNRIWNVSRTTLEVLDSSFLVGCHGIAEQPGSEAVKKLFVEILDCIKRSQRVAGAAKICSLTKLSD